MPDEENPKGNEDPKEENPKGDEDTKGEEDEDPKTDEDEVKSLMTKLKQWEWWRSWLFLETEDEDGVKSSLPPVTTLKRWQRWCLVLLNICLVLLGQASALLLLRFYYYQGGHSKWTATLAQNAGFPILFIPFILFPSIKEPSPKSRVNKVLLVYLALGALIATDNLLYSVGQKYLSTPTYSLICATQLAFTALFSFFINAQKCTSLIFNSIVVLSLSASLVAVTDKSGYHPYVTRSKYSLGVVATLAASALYALVFSLTQLSFQRVIKKETFAVVLELQIHTSIVASLVSLVGLFGSGEWRMLRHEVFSFGEGSLSYVMTLIWIGVAWQVCSVGVVGLIFVVSPLFANAVSTFSLTLMPVAVKMAYHHTMNGTKMIAILLGVWGFSTYVYQNLVDDFVEANQKQQRCKDCSC